MKMLTLNTHSLVEDNYEQKLLDFVNIVAREKPQIIALQEVNQTCSFEEVPAEALEGYYPCAEEVIPLRKDNHLYCAVRLLREQGVEYYWTWIGLKKGYDQYDEGIGLMSLSPILEAESVRVSEIDDYNNWKTRKIIGIRTEAAPEEWFFSVHYGWWNDSDEPFQKQWAKTAEYMKQFGKVWLMGDFNSPAQVRGEGYDMIAASGWQDTYTMASCKDSGITVGKVIDGWKDKISDTHGMRIDQIWCSEKTEIFSSEVIFNGVNAPVVSDHYGIIIDDERNEK